MIQLGKVVKQFDEVVAVHIINSNLPGSHALGLYDSDLVVQGVNYNGIDIPEDKKQGRILDKAPSGFPHQLSFPQPVNQDSHRNNKKEMGELMGINAFDPAVALGGRRIAGNQQNPGQNRYGKYS
jgi:hypothetical protein